MASFNILQNEQMKIIQEFVSKVPIFPYLWIPHCILMAMAVRATVGGLQFSRSHPLACYMMAVTYTFPGAILGSILLAEPPVAFLANTPNMMTMSIVWYAVFYAPCDVFTKLINLLHLRFPLGFLQDFLRIQLVISAVQTIHAVYPGTIIYPIVFAIVKSSGFMFIKYAEALVFHAKRPDGFVVPNHHSKTCILASLLFTAHSVGYVDAEKDLLLLVCVFIALILRVASMLPSANVEPDPYIIFENVACYVLFGQNQEYVDTSCDDKKVTSDLTQNGKTIKNGKPQDASGETKNYNKKAQKAKKIQ